MNKPIIRLLPMGLIDPPGIAVRIAIDDDGIRELALSIREIGLESPIGVMAVGGRYEICYGHRRYLAHKHLGRDEIEAKDYTNTGMDPEMIKAHENLMHRDPTDADWIDWLGDIQAKHHYSEEKLIAITGKPAHWIEQRLRIARGDKLIYDALYRKEINLAQALVLNRFPDDFRKLYLGYVINSTPPARIVEQWLRDLRVQFPDGKLPQGTEMSGPVTAAPAQVQPANPGVASNPCVLCRDTNSPWTMELVNVHKKCITDIVAAIHAGEVG